MLSYLLISYLATILSPRTLRVWATGLYSGYEGLKSYVLADL